MVRTNRNSGPISYYLAAVPNAATASTTGLAWFKVAHDGLSNGKWAVDTMIANAGWHYFTMPTCVAPSDYLLRVELIALHGAQTQGIPPFPNPSYLKLGTLNLINWDTGGAQFYMECAHIRVTGSGAQTGSTVSFPGAYKANDPGVQVNIYDNNGQPYPTSYPIPGPAPIVCSGGGGSGRSPALPAQPAPETPALGAGLYGQCGGATWTGPTTCAQGTCKVSSEHYSQCLP